MRFVYLFLVAIFLINNLALAKNDLHIKRIIQQKRLNQKDPQNVVLNLIERVIGGVHDLNDFIIKFDQQINDDSLDTFQLEMDETNEKLVITANSVIAATLGFNYYLKYYCNSSVFWSGKNINLNSGPLPKVKGTVKITANDHIRYYQNVCTYSYSYVWWNWSRWEYELDWMALNGINLAYAHTASEFVWLSVFQKLGFTRQEIDSFFTGPAYLAWLRMGNIKAFGGSLPDSWHANQVNLQKQILARMDDLGINYILPAFAGFVPDSITRLYPNNNFTTSKDWNGFGCNYSCVYIVNPKDSLFQQIGSLYVQEAASLFGTNHFYSADVFNEMDPSSTDLTYLAEINEAIFKGMQSADPLTIWIMQAWLFGSDFWTADRVEAFLSRIPIGQLILLDLFSEVAPYFERYSSYYGHYFVWNMLHDFGGANGLFGQITSINSGPDVGRYYLNSTMLGIGITMEGINQNELVYEFILEKSWRHTQSESEIAEWVSNYTIRRYYNQVEISDAVKYAMQNITNTVFDNPVYDVYNRQLFTRRPNLDLHIEDKPYINDLYSSWKILVQEAPKYQSSYLFKYDLVDITKEVLRYKFNDQYIKLLAAYNQKDFLSFWSSTYNMFDILTDMDTLLASDSHFLLGKWVEDAKSIATNQQELKLYEINAKLQISLWATNFIASAGFNSLYDYACKGWAGLIKDYYLGRWKEFAILAAESILNGKPIDQNELDVKLFQEVEIPFITSSTIYPNYPIGDSFAIIKMIYDKYQF